LRVAGGEQLGVLDVNLRSETGVFVFDLEVILHWSDLTLISPSVAFFVEVRWQA
jgi:hypothetical protein